MATTKEIVGRFDEVLIEKASKLTLDKLIDDAKGNVSYNDYSNYKISVNLAHQKLGQDIEHINGRMDDIIISVQEEITEQLKKAVNMVTSNYFTSV